MFRDPVKFTDKLRNLEPLMKQMIPLMRKSVRKEFRSQTWDGVHGGGSWQKQKKFGNRPKSKTMQRSRQLLNSWLSGVTKVTKDSAEIQGSARSRSSASTGFEYGTWLRGGGGLSIPSRVNLIVRAKAIGAKGLPKMFWYLGMRFGVWIKPKKLLTEGLCVPTRPHGVVSKALEQDVTKAANKYLARAFGK